MTAQTSLTDAFFTANLGQTDPEVAKAIADTMGRRVVLHYEQHRFLPSKIFEYIQIGRPVLALTPRNSPSERILKNSGIRNLCLHKDSSPEEVDRGLMDFLEWPVDPMQPTEWFRREFDAAARVRKLASLLDECQTGVAVAG